MAKNPESVVASAAVRPKTVAHNFDFLPKDAPIGTLVKTVGVDNDEAWGFLGNGQTTSTELMQTITNREAAMGHGELAIVNHDPAFASQSARRLLSGGSPAFNPDAPIARGQAVGVYLKDLVALVTPFLESYAAQVRQQDRNACIDSDKAPVDERRNPMTGLGVQAGGLMLPLD